MGQNERSVFIGLCHAPFLIQSFKDGQLSRFDPQRLRSLDVRLVVILSQLMLHVDTSALLSHTIKLGLGPLHSCSSNTKD